MQQKIARIGAGAVVLAVLFTGAWLMSQLDGQRQLGYRGALPTVPQPVSALLTPLAPMPLSKQQQLVLMVDESGEASRAEMAGRFWESRQRDRVSTAVCVSELLRAGDRESRSLQVEVVEHGRRVDPDNVRYDYLAAALAMVHHIRIVGPRDARVLRVILPAGFEEALAAYVAATQRGKAVYRSYAAEYVAVVEAVLPLPFEKQVQLHAWERFQREAQALPERELLAMLEEAKGLSGKYGDVGTGEALTAHLAAWEGRQTLVAVGMPEVWGCVRLQMVAGALGVAAWVAFVLLLVLGGVGGKVEILENLRPESWRDWKAWGVAVVGGVVVVAALVVMVAGVMERRESLRPLELRESQRPRASARSGIRSQERPGPLALPSLVDGGVGKGMKCEKT